MGAATSEWIDFLTIHSAILGLGRPDVAAVQRLREACAVVKLDEAACAQVFGALDRPDLTRLRATLERLGASELRFALLADAGQMARGIGIERIDREPALVALSRALAISSEQHAATCAFIAASVPANDSGWSGWRMQIDELRAALERARTAGVATDAVTGVGYLTRAAPSLAGGSFLGVIRLMHDLTLL